VTAVDRDGPPFNRFIYSLRRHADDAESLPFVVNPDTGTVSTTMSLDREQQSVYKLTVVATELAHPQASSTANVTVFIADRNDNAPVIIYPSSTSNKSAVVSLYASPGHVFARVTATDRDWGLNSRLRYSITGGDQPSAAGVFEISADSGVVSVRRDLSVVLPGYVTRLSLVVLVRDCGKPPLNATATLGVLVDRSTRGSPGSSHHGRPPPGRTEDSAHWLTSFGGEFRREFLIILAGAVVMLIIVLLMAIVCVRRRQYLAALAAGGADQVQPQRDRDDAKTLPAIVEVGWSDVDGTTSCGRRSNCDPEFQIVRNIVDVPWKAQTLQSPSRMMSSPGCNDDDAEMCNVYVTTPTSPCVRQQHRMPPQLQTFSVSAV